MKTQQSLTPLEAIAATMSAQHQLQMAERAQRKAQNAAKTAKRALAQMQKMHEDRLTHDSWLLTTKTYGFMFFVLHGPSQIATCFFLNLNYQFGFFFSAHIPQCYMAVAGDGEPWEHARSGAPHESEDDTPWVAWGPSDWGQDGLFSHQSSWWICRSRWDNEATTFFPGSATYIPTAVPEGTTHYDGSEFDDQEPVEVEVEVADSRFQENAEEEEEDFNEDPCFEVEDEPVVVPAPKKRPRHLWSFPI